MQASHQTRIDGVIKIQKLIFGGLKKLNFVEKSLNYKNNQNGLDKVFENKFVIKDMKTALTCLKIKITDSSLSVTAPKITKHSAV